MSENDDEKKVVPPSVILLSSLPQKETCLWPTIDFKVWSRDFSSIISHMHWLQYYIFSLMSFALKEICGPGFVFVTYFANSFDHSLGCHGNRHKQNPYFNCANNTSRTSCHTHSSHQSFSCSSRSWWVEKLYCLLLFNCKIYTLPLTPLEVSGFVSRRILPFPIRWCRGKYHTTDSGGGGEQGG